MGTEADKKAQDRHKAPGEEVCVHRLEAVKTLEGQGMNYPLRSWLIVAGTQYGDVTKSSVTAQVQTLPLFLPTWRTTDTPYKSLGCVPSSETWGMPLKYVWGVYSSSCVHVQVCI